MTAFSDSDLLALASVLSLAILLAGKKALGYVNGQPVELELGSIGVVGGVEVFMRADAAKAFRAMSAAARNDGISLVPTGPRAAFRTSEQQTELTIERAGYANPVGFSNHQSGVAVDLETATGTNKAFAWLKRYGATYGFACPYESKEPWHWEYRP